jgi:signal peptidase I
MKFDKSGVFIFVGSGLLVIVSILLSFALGYRLFFVETPSMGTTAPVGSLAIVKSQDNYQKDDIITFYRGARVYTHRIIGEKDGKFITKGDLNQAADASLVARDDIIGKTLHIWKHLGWLFRALPWLIIGFIVVYLISCLKKIRDSWRWSVRIVGCSIVVIITTFVLNPWFNVQMLGFTKHEAVGVNMRVVNTGVFAIRKDGGGRYGAGEDTVVHVTDIDNKGRYIYTPRPSIGWKGVIFAFLWSIAPLLIGLFIRLPFDDEDLEAFEKGELTQEDIEREKRINFIIFVSFIVIAMALIFFQVSTLAAFVVGVKNTSNTARARSYFNCRNAISGTTGQQPLFAYAMGTVTTQEVDLTGQGRYGTYETGKEKNNATSVPKTPTLDNAYGCQLDTPPNSVVFDGSYKSSTPGLCLINSAQLSSPQAFSIETWFKVPVPAGANDYSEGSGLIVGLSNQREVTYDNDNIDRALYADNAGRLVFSMWSTTHHSSYQRVGSTITVHDGNWHHAVVTFSTIDGTRLYVDGNLAGQNAAAVNVGFITSGWWRIGCGEIKSTPDAGTSRFHLNHYLRGSVQYTAVYSNILTPLQVTEHYSAGFP